MSREGARDGMGGRNENQRVPRNRAAEKIERRPGGADAKDSRAGSKRLLTGRHKQKLRASRSLALVPLANGLRPGPLRVLPSCTQDTAGGNFFHFRNCASNIET